MGALIVRFAKDQIRPYPTDPTGLSGTLPPSPQKTSPGLGHTEPRGRRQCNWSFTNSTGDGNICESASRASSGACWRRWLSRASRRPSSWWLQRTNRDRYLVIDGHKRIAALQQLGRDTVEATVWPMSEAEALLLDRSLRFSSAGKRAGTRLAAVGDGAALRLRAGRTGAPFRPQRELGIAAAGAGGVTAGGHPAASTRRQNLSAGGDEVSGARGARRMRSIASAWPPHSSSTVAIRGKPGNSIRPGAKAHARFASAFSPNRNCF